MSSASSIIRKGGNTSAVLLAFVLFYFPSALAIFSNGHEPRRLIAMSVVMATLYSFVFCINYFWLVPKILVKTEKATLYFIINLLLIISLCTLVQAVMFLLHDAPPGKHMHHMEPTFWNYLMGYLRFVFRDGVMMVLSAGLAYAMRLSRERENFRRRELELNAEKQQIELQSLKAQLNPHFLFNTLNNIYALIGFAPERAQQALHDLSGMLRFMIYDSVAAYVPLEKEFCFISDYVELVKLRLSPSVKMVCNISCGSSKELYVAPLLFLTIVENAFKHCSPSIAGNFIEIQAYLTEGDLVCHVENTYGTPTANDNSLTKESGVGLENVKRQLNLIYPDTHSLSLTKDEGVFVAEIRIARTSLQKHEPKEY